MSAHKFEVGDPVWVWLETPVGSERLDPWVQGKVVLVEIRKGGRIRLELDLYPNIARSLGSYLPTWRWAHDKGVRSDDEHTMACLVL